MKLCIFGAGGSARETYWIAKNGGFEISALIDLQAGGCYQDAPILNEDFFDPDKHTACIALGSSAVRKKVHDNLVKKHLLIGRYNHVFFSNIISRDLLITGKTDRMTTVHIGDGAVIAQKCVLTCDITIGKQCQLNVGTSIMHDAVIGDFFTTAPGVRINGKVKIGNNVYFGSNAVTKEGISVCDDVIVGAGAVVVRDITEPGTYVGVPAKRIK